MVCGDVFVLHRSMGRLCSVVESRCHARGGLSGSWFERSWFERSNFGSCKRGWLFRLWLELISNQCFMRENSGSARPVCFFVAQR